MQSHSGVTLLELIISVTIIALMTSLAAPPMTDFIHRYRSDAQARMLFDLIALGRGQAYGYSRIYTLCPQANGDTCGSDWTSGAMLFADSNGNGQREEGEKVERVMPRLASGASLAWRSFNSKNYLQLRPNGVTLWQSGNFAYCPPDKNTRYGWIIVLNATGRPYFGKDSDGDGIVETGSGKNLACPVAT